MFNPKEYARKYYQRNKKRLDVVNTEWAKKHPERRREHRKKSNKKDSTKDAKIRWTNRNIEKKRMINKLWSSKNKQRRLLARNKYVSKYPEKIYAQYLAKKKLKKGLSCQICGSCDRLEMHHPIYERPLLIWTLCKECHTAQHYKKRRVD